MIYFYVLTLVSMLIVGAVMSWFHFAARDVPDAQELDPRRRTRLNPDQLRLLTYAAIVLVCLLGAIYELWLYYGDGTAGKRPAHISEVMRAEYPKEPLGPEPEVEEGSAGEGP